MAFVDIPGIGTFADDNQRDFPGEQWSRPMVGIFYDNPPPTMMHATDIRDMADEEIQFLADTGQFTGKPIRYDHQEGTDCGKIDRVWREGRTWYVEFRLDQSIPAGRCLTKRIRNGLTQGLSLQHELEARTPIEISVCQRGARPNTRVVQASDTPDNTEQLARRARLNRLFRMCVATLMPARSVAASDTMDYGGSYNGPRTVTRQRPESDAPVVEAPRTEQEWAQEAQLMENQLRKYHGVPPKTAQFAKTDEQKRAEMFEQIQSKVLAEKNALMGQAPPSQPQFPDQYTPRPPPQHTQAYTPAQFPPQFQQQQLPAPPSAPKASDVQVNWPDGFTDEQKEKWLEQNFGAALAKNPLLRQQKEMLDKGVTPQGGGPKILQGEDKDTEMTPAAESKKGEKEPTETERILTKRLRELEEKESKREFETAFARLSAVKGRDIGTGDSYDSLKASYEAQWNSGDAGRKAFLELVNTEEKIFGRKRGTRRSREDTEESGDEEPASKPATRTPSADTSKIGYQDFMRMAEKAREQKLDSLAPPPPAPSGVTVAASAPNSTSAYSDRMTRVQASYPMLGRMAGTLDTLAWLGENQYAKQAGSTQFIRPGRNGEPIFSTPTDFDKTGGKGLWEPNNGRVLQGARVRYGDMYNMDGSLKSQ